MPTVTLDHEEIFYAQHGTSGVPLICLHGAGGSHAGWYNAVKLLDHVSAVALDLPAHGQSTGHGRDSVAAYAEVVSAVLDALRLPAGSGPQARSTAVPGAGSHGPAGSGPSPSADSAEGIARSTAVPAGGRPQVARAEVQNAGVVLPGAGSHGPAGSGPSPSADSAEGIARSTAVPAGGRPQVARAAVQDAGVVLPGAGSHGPADSGPQARSTAVRGAGSHGPAAVLAGHSLGGAIALWLALHQPARVRGLVLAGTGAKLRVHPDILQAAKEGRPVGSAAVLSGQTSSSARPQTAAPEVVYGDWVACDTFNVMDRLGEIHVPTLVLVGAKDMLTPPKYAGFLAHGIKGASLVTIEGAAHSPMIDKPSEVAAAIQLFIDSLRARA